jgi:hypothetical protein
MYFILDGNVHNISWFVCWKEYDPCFEHFTNRTTSEWLAPKLGGAQFEWNFVRMGKFLPCHWPSSRAVFQGCAVVMHMVFLVAACISRTRHFSAYAP